MTTLFGSDKKGGGLNGKTGEVVRMALTAIAAAALAFFALRERVSVVEATEMNHFQEIQRALSDLKSDIREIRDAVKR